LYHFLSVKGFISRLVIFLALCTAVTMMYGFYLFPDAPIRGCGPGCYEGKQGQVRTAEDYRAFSIWLVVMPVLFISTFGLGSTLYILEKRGKKPGGTEA
jgi:hypothetical protein